MSKAQTEAESMHGISFDIPVKDLGAWGSGTTPNNFIGYLLERCRRAEAKEKETRLRLDGCHGVNEMLRDSRSSVTEDELQNAFESFYPKAPEYCYGRGYFGQYADLWAGWQDCAEHFGKVKP